jgi:hypothetical protein
MRLFINAITFILISVFITGCQSNEKTAFYQMKTKVLESKLRNYTKGNLTQQKLENESFQIDFIQNLASNDVVNIKDVAKDSPYMVFFKRNKFDENNLHSFNLYFNLRKYINVLFILDESCLRTLSVLRKDMKMDSSIFLTYVKECACEIPYHETMIFLLDTNKIMRNVFIIEDKTIGEVISYTKLVYNKYFTTTITTGKSDSSFVFFKKNNETIPCVHFNDIINLSINYILDDNSSLKAYCLNLPN